MCVYTATDIVLSLNWTSRKQYNLKTEEMRGSAQNALRLLFIGYSQAWQLANKILTF